MKKPVFVQGFTMISASSGNKTVPVAALPRGDSCAIEETKVKFMERVKTADLRFHIDDIPDGYVILH